MLFAGFGVKLIREGRGSARYLDRGLHARTASNHPALPTGSRCTARSNLPLNAYLMQREAPSASREESPLGIKTHGACTEKVEHPTLYLLCP